MNPERRTGRASEIIGRLARDTAGRPLGRVADLRTERSADGTHRIVAALVVHGPWGRLLGYERDEATGPWIVQLTARHILRRNAVETPWRDLRLDEDDSGQGSGRE